MYFQNGMFITAMPKSPEKAKAIAESHSDTIVDHTCKLYIFKNANPINHWKTSCYNVFLALSRIKIKTNSGKYGRMTKEDIVDTLYYQPIVGFTPEEIYKEFFSELKSQNSDLNFYPTNIDNAARYMENYKSFIEQIGTDIESSQFEASKLYGYLDTYFVNAE
jgi:hypothetical protein